LPPDTPPSPLEPRSPTDWTPFSDRVEFETAEFLYTRNQMSAGDINSLLELWAASLAKHNEHPPFADAADLYDTISSTELGDVKWESFSIQFAGEKPDVNPPAWMSAEYDVWFRDPRQCSRNIIGNPLLAKEMDLRPHREYSTHADTRQWKDFMSGDWAWEQAVRDS
ncbi:hypothetical protein BU15DRAFT_57787, partial [Melanogaster broomeanus]